MLHVVSPEAGAAYTATEFHPDGSILATSMATGVVKMWGINSQQSGTVVTGHEGAVNTLAISKNGHFLATGGDDGFVKLWDLRVMSNEPLYTFECSGTAVNAVKFDHSGQYIVTGCSETRVHRYDTFEKAVSTLKIFDDDSGAVTAVGFSQNATMLFSTSMKGGLTFCGPDAASSGAVSTASGSDGGGASSSSSGGAGTTQVRVAVLHDEV